MKARTYKILHDAVVEGVSAGYHKAHSHAEEPSKTELLEAVRSSIMREIDERFSFEDELPPLR